MKKIRFDKQKHKIAIIASSHSSVGYKEKLSKAQEILNSSGFECIWDENILSGHDMLDYLASSKKQRVGELKKALENPATRIIWLFRGGSDALEIALKCTKVKPVGNKIFIGFSDGTCLHFLFNQIFNMPSIHSSVITTLLGNQKEMFDSIMKVLAGNTTTFELETMNEKARDAKIAGKITGGNLAVISDSLIGTDLHPIMDDKIIFLEDVAELPYALLRALNHLKNTNLFSKAKAIILGDFTFNNKNLTNEENIEIKKQINNTLNYFATNELPNIPFFKANGIGHEKLNYPVVMMEDVTIEDNILTIPSPFELI